MVSPTADDTPQWSINLVHIHLFYHDAQAKQAQHGSLVDRGANGGLAGSDVMILSKSSKKCTVTGIDQHKSMVWTFCNVLHWLIPTMDMLSSS